MNSITDKVYKFVKDPYYRVSALSIRGVYNRVDDKSYLQRLYHAKFGKSIDFDNPKTFNEKLQYLKLYDRKPVYTTMVDKYAVKKYVASIIGEQFVIPTYGVWDSFDSIDFTRLPEQFVLKCTHDSGGVVICKDKSQFDYKGTKKIINNSLAHNYFYNGREWPYKDVPPKIIAEKYMIDCRTKELRDYKFFCFNGVVKCFKVDFDRFIEHHANYYDIKGDLLPFGEADYPPVYNKTIEMPSTIPEMIELASKLSNGIPFLRVDFYDVDGTIFFGELTFFPASGFGKFIPEEADSVLGDLLQL